jgi:hypothetical protein
MTLTLLRRAALGLAGGLLMYPAAAHAATVSAQPPHDPQTTFTVNGATVTVTSTNQKLLRRVAGHDVVVLCEAGIGALTTDGPPQLPVDFSVLADHATWPAGATSATVILPRDVSATVDLCGLGLNGASQDADTMAAFTAAGRNALAEDERSSAEVKAEDAALLRLNRAFQAAKRSYDRDGRRWGTAHAVAHDIHARRPKLVVRVAHTLRGAKAKNVVYVIERGTGGRRLTLAIRDATGKLHVLRWRGSRLTLN